ncbi:hypothetical protein FVO80_11270 [Mycobacterium avium subsp. hominissuis]|nr:hypothetical protein [Mycobacterium avium subsp. hominissuis]MBZ4576865.1 hypothetical protein [Mycobacterium avium subsp. hominissuis]MBZ4592144.1 hypothetical protein [Mycobacterium avium subsp. hominissuis]MBZ4604780.1 hypothetical protein [Mycobacterium avium subsp. hominissuis]MBZ4634324.1 hypothetical protein [Mycobacterium avium subsp. hominissuis]
MTPRRDAQPTQVKGVQSIVTGVVQAEVVMAVAARTMPRTSLYFKRDITTPFVEKECFAREGLSYVS